MAQRILVADNEPNIRLVLTMALEQAGYTVEAVADGLACISALTTDPTPDLLVLDLRLPRLTGQQVVQHLRADPRTADLPILIVTGSGRESDLPPKNTYQGLLYKPFDLDRLVEAAARLLEAGTP